MKGAGGPLIIAWLNLFGRRHLTWNFEIRPRGSHVPKHPKPTAPASRPSTPRGQTTPSTAASALPVGIVTTLFVAACVLYGLYFFRVPIGPGVTRMETLPFLVAPDQLWRQWCDAPDGRVNVLDRLPCMVLAGSVWVVAWLTGRLLLRLMRIEGQLVRLEHLALALGLGLSLWSLGTLAVGLAGGRHQPLIFVIAAVIIGVLNLFGLKRGARRSNDLSSSDTHLSHTNAPSRSIESRWWWVLAIPFLLVLVGGALLPPIDFDVLEYHLQVPREWVENGRIDFLPHNVYGNMPLGAEALVALTMSLMPGDLSWWWGGLAGKLVMAGFAPLTGVLLLAAGRRYATPTAGRLAALLYISSPCVIWVSVSGLNEGVIAYYTFAAMYAARRWFDEQRQTPGDESAGRVTGYGFVVLAGWMAGTAIACKYTSLVLVGIPLLLFVVCAGRRNRWRATAACAMAMSLACGLWFAKNAVQTGNPTYPLLANVFDSHTRTDELNRQFAQAHRVPRDAAGWRYSPRQAWHSVRRVLGESDWHNPLLIPCVALVVFWQRTRRRAAFWLAGFACLALGWWLFTHRLDRFLIPAWPLLALVAGMGAGGIGAAWSESTIWRRAVWTIVILGSAANFVLVTLYTINDNRFLVDLQQMLDEPQRSGTPIAHQFLNTHVPAGKRVLLVGDAAVYDLRVPFLYSTCFDPCVFEQLMRGRTVAERARILASLQISHIYVNWAEIARYRQPGNYGFTDYVTPSVLHDEMAKEQQLIRRVDVPELEPSLGELFEVLPSER